MTWLRKDEPIRPDRLAALFGVANCNQVLLVTSRGVELPVLADSDWTVLELNAVLTWIDGLPELESDSRLA